MSREVGIAAPVIAASDGGSRADGKGSSKSWFLLVLARLVRNPKSVVGMIILGSLIVLALLAPIIARYDPNGIDISSLNQSPSGAHWFGTDYVGRDVWARCLYGARVSLPAGFSAVLIGLAIGLPAGLLAGYGSRLVDDVIMRVVDLVMSFPGFLLAIGIIAILGPSLRSAVVAVGFAMSPGFARLARGSTLSLREHDYVLAAHALGAGQASILRRHVLVNVLDPIIVLATLSVGGAILATAGLSFLGLATQLPTSDWGSMLGEGYNHMFQSGGEVWFPGLAIMLTVLGINFLGEGLTESLNPQLDIAG